MNLDDLKEAALKTLTRKMNARMPGLKGKDLLAKHKFQSDAAKHILDFIKVWAKINPEYHDENVDRYDVVKKLTELQEKLSAEAESGPEKEP